MDARVIPHSWLDPRVEIRPSPISGCGLFAHEPIAAGEMVERWGGVHITDAEVREIAATVSRYNSAAIGEGINLLLALDDLIGFGNHSCDANLWMRDAITVEARRAIARDEELTIDYATHTVTPSWRMETECRCGSPLCRHIITGDDWQLPELQRRYRGHFSPFINDRIARLQEVSP
jgi:hypothetical protein